jgi:hypothetical protein
MGLIDATQVRKLAAEYANNNYGTYLRDLLKHGGADSSEF